MQDNTDKLQEQNDNVSNNIESLSDNPSNSGDNTVVLIIAGFIIGAVQTSFMMSLHAKKVRLEVKNRRKQ